MTSLQDDSRLDTSREPVRFLVFSASLRTASLNSRLAALAAHTIEQHGGQVDVVAMERFDAPSYDQDVQNDVGFPPDAEEFRFQRTIVAFMDLVEAAKHYPCAKKAWIEFLRRAAEQSNGSHRVGE